MFTTYSASAGSGKTTHLVADYIALCFKHDSRDLSQAHPDTGTFRRILAITFTNNAAAEMKERIVQTLEEIAFTPFDKMKSRSQAIYKMVVDKLFKPGRGTAADISAFMQRESLELLRSIIYDYARFSLSTIDSFFQRVIRSAALSLNLNLNYSVQIDLNEFFIQAIDQLLTELTAGSELSKKLVFMLNNSMEDSGNLKVDKELRQVLDILYANAEKNYDYLQIMQTFAPEEYRKTILTWRNARKEIPDKLRNAIRDIAAEGQRHIDNLQGLNFQKPTLGNWFKKVMEDPIANFETDIEVFVNEKTGSYFKKMTLTGDEQARVDAEMPGIIDCFNQIRDIQKKYRTEYLDACLLLKNADKMLLLFDLKQKMDAIKEQRNIFILSESNTFIYDHIKGKDTPELFDRIPYTHYFIDEFQDTSDLQWKDLKPLIVNKALATNGQVTLFGDVKQAIYRFRNGEADLFYNLIDYGRLKNDPDLAVVSSDNYENECLDYNFRSSTPVIRFNNTFFEQYSRILELSHFYSDVEQKIHKERPGLVEVFMAGDDSPAEKKESSKEKATYVPTQRTCQHQDMHVEAFCKGTSGLTTEDIEVLRAVADALSRGYDYGDIAILYAGNDKNTRMANLLMNLGYPVVTEKSLVLSASPAVNLIIQVLRCLIQPNDRVAQTTILHHVARQNNKETDLNQALLNFSDLQFQKLMKEIHGKEMPLDWKSEPLFPLVKKIIHFFDLDATQDPFIVDFENIVLNYIQDRNGEPAQFLSWWQMLLDTDKMFSLTLPTDINAIKVSTIHKSKGLEYPVVILPYKSTTKRAHSIWTITSDHHVAYIPMTKKDCIGSSFEALYEEEMRHLELDTLNLLYVAHTRAGDMLYVITENTASGYGHILHDLILRNERETTPSDPLHFTCDPQDSHVHYTGQPDWRKKRASEKLGTPVTPPIKTSPFSIGAISKFIDTDAQSKQQLAGTAIHDFLAHLEQFPQNMEDVEPLITHLEETQQQRLREAFQKILENEELRPCFAPGVQALNETTIVDCEGVEHRPDRVVMLPDRVVVIDYKTGKQHDSYQQQVDQYCNLLRGMGYQNVTGRILYI
ncbi:MAG: UvrD-helicase domain-containing protein [Bacteroidales bacterium]|nr:UvrD-helicase domain-containing protein [Bacteroidales bacterium]